MSCFEFTLATVSCRRLPAPAPPTMSCCADLLAPRPAPPTMSLGDNLLTITPAPPTMSRCGGLLTIMPAPPTMSCCVCAPPTRSCAPEIFSGPQTIARVSTTVIVRNVRGFRITLKSHRCWLRISKALRRPRPVVMPRLIVALISLNWHEVKSRTCPRPITNRAERIRTNTGISRRRRQSAKSKQNLSFCASSVRCIVGLHSCRDSNQLGASKSKCIM